MVSGIRGHGLCVNFDSGLFWIKSCGLMGFRAIPSVQYVFGDKQSAALNHMLGLIVANSGGIGRRPGVINELLALHT